MSTKTHNVFLEKMLPNLPKLGFGLGLKDSFVPELLTNRQTFMQDASQAPAAVDWVEIIPENYMKRGGQARSSIAQLQQAGFQFASHGVNLSIGSTDPLNETYLHHLETLFQTVQPHWFSDHLCFSSINGRYLNDLLPLPFTWEAIDHCAQRIQQVQTRIGLPFLLENISYYADFSQDEGITEAVFLREIVERADCGLLLDVNNVYVNSQNHGYDPMAFMKALPLERVAEIHIAGHLVEADGLIIDTHGEAICQDVFSLLSHIYPKCPNIKAVLLERDTNIPSFETLQNELQIVRQTALSRMPVESSLALASHISDLDVLNQEAAICLPV
jgi:uncharacterized protein